MRVNAIILAGGKGSRLRPITYEIPKPLLPVRGKAVILHLIELFKLHNIKDIVISIGYLKDRIKEQLGNGKDFGVRIKYVEERLPLGTGGALKKAMDILSNTFICTNGDELKDINLKNMLRFHKKNNCLVTIAIKNVKNVHNYGVVKLRNSKIVEFIEKPKNMKNGYINTGLYVMEKKFISKYIGNGFVSLEREVFPIMAKEGELLAYKFRGQWFDTGTFDRYEKAIKYWKGLSKAKR